MSKRSKMSNSHSKAHFTRHALRTHPRNNPPASSTPLRGGIRL